MRRKSPPVQIGEQFTWLTVSAAAGKGERGETLFFCTCRCGATVTLSFGALRGGNNKSCGCYKRQLRAAQNFKHGKATTPIYKKWAAIVQRCTNPRDRKWADYGGRGIDICPQWRENFSTFYAAVGDPPFPKAELDRKDNDRGYYPDNVHWVTRREQLRNTRRSHLISFRGRTLCLIDWAQELGLHSSSLYQRIIAWGLERALSLPRQKPGPKKAQ